MDVPRPFKSKLVISTLPAIFWTKKCLLALGGPWPPPNILAHRWCNMPLCNDNTLIYVLTLARNNINCPRHITGSRHTTLAESTSDTSKELNKTHLSITNQGFQTTFIRGALANESSPIVVFTNRLRTPNEGINQKNLKNWTDVDCSRKNMPRPYLKIWEWE